MALRVHAAQRLAGIGKGLLADREQGLHQLRRGLGFILSDFGAILLLILTLLAWPRPG